MSTVYITGDRSFDPIVGVSVVAAIMNNLIQETGGAIRVITGNSPTGIERTIRYLVPEQFVTVVDYPMSDGKPDFLAAMSSIKAVADGGAYVLHTDPLNSRLAQAVSQSFDPDLVRFPLEFLNQTPSDLSMFDENLDAPISEEDVPPEVK